MLSYEKKIIENLNEMGIEFFENALDNKYITIQNPQYSTKYAKYKNYFHSTLGSILNLNSFPNLSHK